MTNNEKQNSTQLSLLEEEEIQIIIQHWIRTLNIKLGWIMILTKLVVNYASTIFMLNTFCSSSKLLKIFSKHNGTVYSIDYSTLDDNQLICSGSQDKTVYVWNVDTNQQIQSFNGHSNIVYCVKFSPYHYHYHHRNVICSSSSDKTIRFWDFKDNQQLQIYNNHNDSIGGIEFSSFNGGRYLCSGSYNNLIYLYDVKTSKALHVFNGHENSVWCIDISPLQSNNSNKSNNIGVIGGNGYTICSGSFDKTIRIWDIETTKQLILFKGHDDYVWSVKYGSNKLENIGANTILSGSEDKSVRLWDIRSGKLIQVFNGHTDYVNAVEYSPFEVNNIEVNCYSNVICSGSNDNTIRFWDIRSNKNELYLIKRDEGKGNGIFCLKFIQLKKNRKSNSDSSCGINLCYGSGNGNIFVWG
ncbi:WD-40 repeat protein [Reticulomyxa filosa]|uniref:WD-40 repeat protein n=1 Tax=Reticulomyxa filosa TaxID=46433 RepID=X6MFN9_RETFI|nr:WD-40 repeat protein [Reticulomyxa filosa]|eukprot:ETO12237.1 WD-40 repeat protein [Reticulomyxa filosa]